MSRGIPLLGRLKEAVRPYYLRWFYFPLRPRQRPPAFQACWQYPFQTLADSVRLPEPPADLPDLLFYPMTDWHTRIQRTQHLVRAFAGLGFRCIYLNPHLGREFETTPLFDKEHRLAQLEDNIFELHIRLPREPVFHDRLLTAEEEDLIVSTIRRILAPRAPVIQILSFPLWRGVAGRFRAESGFPMVYDCHDLLSGFRNIYAGIVAAEADLLREADLVLFSSQGLLDHYRGVDVRKRLLVRNAADPIHPASIQSVENGPSDPQAEPPAPPPQALHFQRWGRRFRLPFSTAPIGQRPVAGYAGALDSWFDIEAVEQAASQNPQCRFVLAGRVEFAPIRRLQALPNVEFAGEIPYSGIPRLLAEFRVALIPFRLNPLTLMTNPIKMYEYFSCGLPVVSTPLPEVQAMGNLVYIGATPAEFARQVTRALAEDDRSRRSHRKEMAGRESWTERARSISEAFLHITSGR